jgi:uracil-DNA glycosylase family 4
VGGEADSIGIAEARSALAWWLEAGVDAAIQEEPRNWLRPRAPDPAPAPVRPNSEGEDRSLPDHETLAELRDWLATSEQLPMAGRAARRVLPHGPEGAAVMLLVEAPEDASGGPISGEAWELAQRMLAAIRIPVDEVYSAALSCFHVPGVRMSPADRDACAEIALRQIRLVAPKRLLLLGNAPSQALLGKRFIEARGHVHKVQGVRTVATFHPRHLIKRPLDKSLAWQDLLLLMEDES